EPPQSKTNDDSELQEVILKSRVAVGEIFENVRAGRSVEHDDLEDAVDMIYSEVVSTTNIFRKLITLRDKYEYTLQHSVAVGALGVKICQLLNWPDSEAKKVGVAGLFHDIGKGRISDSIMKKPGSLSEIEWAEMKRHSQYGYEILKNDPTIDPQVQLAVLQHHERLNGKGYPLRLKDKQIHPYAKIVAIADAFDAITSERCYQSPMSVFSAADELLKDAYQGGLELEVVLIFIDYLLDMVPGERVVLNTGQEAEVQLLNRSEPNRPLVRTSEGFVDLVRNRELCIAGFSEKEEKELALQS
ncbi:MAG: HD-GYP domain-containing protein, partial [Syntrophomonadaceae bacterium]|nr:HD-GYP domain-containing protein [Syntrophomonadaceae bacterium]